MHMCTFETSWQNLMGTSHVRCQLGLKIEIDVVISWWLCVVPFSPFFSILLLRLLLSDRKSVV